MRKNIERLQIGIVCLLLSAFIVIMPSYASGAQCLTEEYLISLGGSDLLNILLDNGLMLPDDYLEHRSLAETFVKEYTPKILNNEINPYAMIFNATQSNQMMNNLGDTLHNMGIIEGESYNSLQNVQVATNYTLVDNTLVGSWSSTYYNYNCYGYALGRTDIFRDPGCFSETNFSLTMSISEMADIVLADLNALGYSGVKVTSKPVSLPDAWTQVICIRKNINNVDYHFMKMASNLNTWRHKPGHTQILQWNYTSPGAKTWVAEYVGSDNVAAYSGITYSSQIYYIVFKSNNAPGRSLSSLTEVELIQMCEP